MIIPAILLGILAGLFTKTVDLAEDSSLKLNRMLVNLSGITYGLLLALAAYKYNALAPLIAAVVAAVIITGKMDAKGHYFGIASFVFFLALLGAGPVVAAPLAIFFFAAVLDEKASDLADRKYFRNKTISKILGYRPFLEITAFIFAALTGLWLVWFYLLAFDITYLLTPQIMKGINNFSAGKNKKAY